MKNKIMKLIIISTILLLLAIGVANATTCREIEDGISYQYGGQEARIWFNDISENEIEINYFINSDNIIQRGQDEDRLLVTPGRMITSTTEHPEGFSGTKLFYTKSNGAVHILSIRDINCVGNLGTITIFDETENRVIANNEPTFCENNQDPVTISLGNLGEIDLKISGSSLQYIYNLNKGGATPKTQTGNTFSLTDNQLIIKSPDRQTTVDFTFGNQNNVIVLDVGCVEPSIPLCSDSDNGINIYEKSTTTGARWDKDYVLTSRTDYCVARSGSAGELSSCTGDNCGVYEFSCTSVNGGNQFVNGNIHACNNGCSNGECLEEQICTDSDGGMNYYEKGFAEMGRIIQHDRCYSQQYTGSPLIYGETGTSVMEARCQYHDGRTSVGGGGYTCPNGCQSGACLQEFPDLIITKIDVDPHPKVGNKIEEMDVVVKNIGEGIYNGRVDVDFVIDRNGQEFFEEGSGGTIYLSKDESTTITIDKYNFNNMPIFEDGSYELTVYLDTTTRESNGHNNQYEEEFDLTSSTTTCTDSDGGIDYYNKGTVSVCTYSTGTTGATGSSGGAGCGGSSDYCSGSYLYEKYCSGNAIQSKKYLCVNGCDNGVCIKTPIVQDMLDEPFIGPDDAPVKIVAYMNYFEKYSPQAFDVIDKLGREYPNKFSFQFSNFPLWGNHFLGANAAECAYGLDPTDDFFEFTQEVFEELDMSVGANDQMHEEQLKIELTKIAVRMGFKEQEFKSCLDSKKYDAEVNHDKQTGQNKGVQGVPTFFINGKKASNWQYSTIKPMIDEILEQTTCTDSDGGKNYYTKGTFSGYWNDEFITRTDFCTDSGNSFDDTGSSSMYLREGFCENGQLRMYLMNCPNGCRDGVCVKEQSGIVFDSGRGNGPYDKMTYLNYYAEIMFTPTANMVIDAIDPDDYYCNGECYFNAVIYDNDNKKLAEADSSTTASGYLKGTLDKYIKLYKGKQYKIYQHAWTTKSVGIYTAGPDNPKYSDNGKYKINYAKSDTANHIKRGPVGFKLRGAVESTQICKDSDNGKNQFVKGSTSSHSGSNEVMKIETDQCITRYGSGAKNVDSCPASDRYCNVLETFCDADNNPNTEGMRCPNGCRNGACIREDNDYSFSIWTDEKFYDKDDRVKISARIEADSINTPQITPWVEDTKTNMLTRVIMRQMTCAVNSCQPGVYCPSIETCTYEGYYQIGSSHTITTLSSAQEDILKDATEEVSSGDTQVASATSQPMPAIELNRYNVLAIASMNGVSIGAKTNFYVKQDQVRDVDVDFDLKSSYDLEENIILKVDNIGNTPVKYWGVCSTPYHIEMWANNQWNTLITEDPCAVRCLGMGQVTLDPGESKVLGTWNQKIYADDCRYDDSQDTAEHIPEYTMADKGTYRAVFRYTDDNGNTEREINKFQIIGEDECSWVCMHAGTRSEGWYDSCTGDLIRYEQCETPEPPIDECDGCLKDESCISYGTRLIVNNKPQYCSLDKEFKTQLPEGRVCQNSYECSSNSCLSGECTDLSNDITDIRDMVTKIFNWLRSIFG